MTRPSDFDIVDAIVTALRTTGGGPFGPMIVRVRANEGLVIETGDGTPFRIDVTEVER